MRTAAAFLLLLFAGAPAVHGAEGLEGLRTRLTRVKKKIEDLAGPGEEKRPDREARERWERDRAAALEFFFDTDAFPDVAARPMISPAFSWERAARRCNLPGANRMA